jgi:antitoxin component YwqK of YwqJK toxin-antitoxin module
MAIYTDKEQDGNLTKVIEITVTRNYYKSGSIKVEVPIDLDVDNLDVQQFLSDEGLADDLENRLQESSLESCDDDDEYNIF